MTGTMDPSANFNLIVTQTELERFKFLIRSFLRARIAKVNIFLSPFQLPLYQKKKQKTNNTRNHKARQIPPPPPPLPQPQPNRITIPNPPLHATLPPLLNLLFVFVSHAIAEIR